MTAKKKGAKPKKPPAKGRKDQLLDDDLDRVAGGDAASKDAAKMTTLG
jgi:hypothetical protein